MSEKKAEELREYKFLADELHNFDLEWNLAFLEGKENVGSGFTKSFNKNYLVECKLCGFVIESPDLPLDIDKLDEEYAHKKLKDLATKHLMEKHLKHIQRDAEEEEKKNEP